MCNLSQLVEEKGRLEGKLEDRQEGIHEERISTLIKLVKSGKMTTDESLEFLEIPKADWPKYHALLADQ